MDDKFNSEFSQEHLNSHSFHAKQHLQCSDKPSKKIKTKASVHRTNLNSNSNIVMQDLMSLFKRKPIGLMVRTSRLYPHPR